MNEQILIISGATATGKSKAALKIAQEKEIAIINADSLQIFEGLPILSAQPNHLEKSQIPHFLYSRLMPHEHCSVGLWLKFLQPIVIDLWRQNKLPVIVGGTGLYISKLVDGISEIPEIETIHKKMANELYEKMGLEAFREKYGEGKIIDKSRLIRACEVFLQTKKPISFWQNSMPKKLFPEARISHFNLNLHRAQIYQNCNLRFREMLDLGAIDEVKKMVVMHGENCGQIVHTLGFSEISAYLRGELSLENAVQIATQKTRNYVKRQITWFRHQFAQINFCVDEQELINRLRTL